MKSPNFQNPRSHLTSVAAFMRCAVVSVLLMASAFCAIADVSIGNAPADTTKGTSAERQKALIAILKSDAKPQEKAVACKRLAVYGDKEAVPFLAPLLWDEQLA